MTELTRDQIYLQFKSKVTGYVFSKVQDRNAAEDIVEDVFIKIYENLDRYDASKASISTWIYTITSRTVTDYYRTRKIFGQIPSESGEEGRMPLQLIDGKEPDEDILEAEQLDDLANALQQLTERERDLIILYYYNEKTLKSIADQMGMSYSNVKIVHRKALAKMKQCM